MKRSIKKTLYAATLTLTGVGLAVVPANASSSSAGTSEGGFNEYDQVDYSAAPPLPLCIGNASEAILTLDNVDAITGAATTATIKIAAGQLFFNPVGTFTDSSCTIPGLAPATLQVSGAVTCAGEPGSASYGREGELGLVTGSCGDHTWVFEGSQQPCFPGAPFDPCAIGSEWVGTYEQIQES